MGRTRVWIAAFGVAFWVSAAGAQLPPAVQRDRLELRMIEQVGREDYPGFLQSLAEFRRLGGQPPLEMSYYEGVALANTGDPIGGAERISAFLSRAGRENPLYRDALAQFDRVEPLAQAARAVAAALAPLQAALGRASAHVTVQRHDPDPGSPWRKWHTGFGVGAEHWRGAAALPDGGWLAFGHRPAGEVEGQWPGPSTRGHPPAALRRIDAYGRVVWTRTYDWNAVSKLRLRPRITDTSGLGIAADPVRGPPTVLGFAPASPFLLHELPWRRLQAGDRITHVNGRMIGAEDNPFALVRGVEGALGLTVHRPGTNAPIIVTGERDVSVASVSWWAPRIGGAAASASWFVGANRVNDRWTSQAVAAIWDGENAGRVCFNISFPGQPRADTGFWARINGEGELVDGHVWGLPLDHPDNTPTSERNWYDSRLLDCVRLPDGGMLTVSRGVPRAIANQRAVPQTVNNAIRDADVRIFRIIAPDGAIRATHRATLPAARAKDWNDNAINTDWHRHRFAAQPFTNGWGFTWGPWLVDTSSDTIRVNDNFDQPRAWYSNGEWKLAIGASDFPLAGGGAIRWAGLIAHRQITAGSYVALVNVQLAEGVDEPLLPDGSRLGAERRFNQFGTIPLLVGLHPADSTIRWAVPLRHGLITGPNYWTNLSLLADGSLLATVPAGPGMIVHPVAR